VGDTHRAAMAEALLWPRPRCTTTDGRFAGRQPRRTSGAIKKPDSSRKTSQVFSRAVFFLIRGQVVLIHPWILSSSGSTARRWGLQPRERRRRPI